jgi:DNA-binding transcriptional regulator LsrR (DeoR family)
MKPTEIHHREIEVVAYLHYKGATEKSIAKLIGRSTTTINNRLSEAREKGLLVEKRDFCQSKMSHPDRFDELQLLDYTVLLRARLRERSLGKKESPRFHELTVLDSGGTGISEKAIKERLNRFGQRVGPLVKRMLIGRSDIVGVSWGTTLAAIVKELQPEPGYRPPPIRFVPTCGEPLEVRHRENSSSFLAGEFDRFINGTTKDSLSLSGVPAVIPLQFHNDKQHAAVIRCFFEEATAYGEIFGKHSGTEGEHERKKPVIDTIDTILTSVGFADRSWSMCGRELCETGGISKSLFTNLVIGDLAGVLIPKDKEIAKNPEFKKIERLWTGIQRGHLETIAKNTRTHDAPGVVVIAIGKNKAAPLLAAIEEGLVNAAFCDEDLARELAKLCKVTITDEAIRAYLKTA